MLWVKEPAARGPGPRPGRSLDDVPDEVQKAAAGLRYTSVRCVNLGIGRERLTEKHWIYYPEETVFHRIFVQGNASPHCNPPGGFGLTCEITYGPLKPLPCDGDALLRRCIDDCIKVGMFTKDDPIWAANQVDMPFAYVVYDHARPKNVATIREWLERHDLLLAGRYSEWEYYNSDHAFLIGKSAAEPGAGKTDRYSMHNLTKVWKPCDVFIPRSSSRDGCGAVSYPQFPNPILKIGFVAA